MKSIVTTITIFFILGLSFTPAKSPGKSRSVLQENQLSMAIFDKHAMENIQALKDHVTRPSGILTVLCQEHTKAALADILLAQQRLTRIRELITKKDDKQGIALLDGIAELHGTVKACIENLENELKKDNASSETVSPLVKDCSKIFSTLTSKNKELKKKIEFDKKMLEKK